MNDELMNDKAKRPCMMAETFMQGPFNHLFI